jgi:hypothetical protein
VELIFDEVEGDRVVTFEEDIVGQNSQVTPIEVLGDLTIDVVDHFKFAGFLRGFDNVEPCQGAAMGVMMEEVNALCEVVFYFVDRVSLIDVIASEVEKKGIGLFFFEKISEP